MESRVHRLLSFLSGGAILPHCDVVIPEMPLRGSGHQFANGVVRSILLDCEIVCAGNGEHAQLDSRISAIMKSGWRVGLSIPFVDFVLCDGVSPATGKADELGFQAVPSSMPAVTWTRSCFVTTFARHVSHVSLIMLSLLELAGIAHWKG